MSRASRAALAALVLALVWSGLLAGRALVAPQRASAAKSRAAPRVTVGSKKFTEGIVLAELMAQTLEAAGLRVSRRFNLGGTQLAYAALRSGQIDVYPEYTGTVLRSVLRDKRRARGPAEVLARTSRAMLARDGLMWLAPLGFNNTYVIAVHGPVARRLGLRRLTDLAAHRQLRWGVSYEFLRRADGMPALRRAYKIATPNLVGMEHDLAYQALASGKIDVTDGYATDAKLAKADVVLLADDKRFFPPYEAAPLVRADLLSRAPRAVAALSLLAGRIDDAAMRRLNARVALERATFAAAASAWLRSQGISSASAVESKRAAGLLALLWQRRGKTLALAGQHLMLSGIAVLAACLLGIPLGVLIGRRPRAATAVLAVAGVLQTVPSIALLAFMLPLFGVGARPAIVALFLYGLLPILRNTVTGLRGVDPRLLEVGTAMGMRRWQRLWQVELPLCAPTILAGVRTSMVINIGTATLAAFIGAGGLGEPIVTGLALTDTNLVLCGALPAALLAVLVDGLLAGIERLATPAGLRVAREQARAAQH